MKTIDPAATEMSLINKQNEDIFNQLVKNPKVNVLPEKLFVQNFLPFFCGELDPKVNEEFFTLWISIAGSPMAELDIIDQFGEVLFRVPPMIDSSVINPNREAKSINFSEVVIMAKLYSNMTPAAGQKALDKGLGEKYRQLQAKSVNFEPNFKRWLEILKRYNKSSSEPNQTSTQTPVVTKTTNNSELDDDMEF